MNIKHHTHPNQLERYSFLWSEARLLVAALALFIGGYPPILYFNPISGLYSLLSAGLHLAWIISGVASAYMVYRWNQSGQKLFAGKIPMDNYTFFVSVVSGINLGLTGVLGTNIGMSITSSRGIFFVVGLIYLFSAYYLWTRWKKAGEKIY